MTKRVAYQQADWLNLVEPVGAFLTLPVMRRVFPQGLDVTPRDVRSGVREALEELGDDVGERTAWLRFLLRDVLQWGDRLVEGPAVSATLTHLVPEHGVTLRPDAGLMDPPDAAHPQGRCRLMVCRWPLHTPLDRRPGAGPDGTPDRWAASPIERAVTLCRETDVPLALITDTERFVLVWAPRKASAGWATWVSSLFGEERSLFDAFTSLLGAQRFFGAAPGDTLEALFIESASAQAELTDQLGRQVRAAVELLVGAMSRADRASDTLLAEVPDAAVYNAAVTMTMRLVFLLSAEERRLFPIDDELYLNSYAVTSLRDQLRSEADRDGDEALERRATAWHRLLATSRAVFGGIQHERLRLPAYGGGLFDPDRYAFLEGRADDESWRDHEATPIEVDDRTILNVMEALQVLTFRVSGVTEARRVSYRNLDIEQIGHVYEGLLDHGCVRADRLVLGLDGKKGEEPEIALEELEQQRAKGSAAFLAWLEEQTGRKPNQSERLLARRPEVLQQQHLRAACDNDAALFERVLPFWGLVRLDLRGLPVLILAGSVYVTQTSERRDSGTQYTTKDLADEIVRYALEPIVYSPGPAETADPAAWKLKSAAELLKLKVCDPAVGSGAILVAACRFLAERLVEAWDAELKAGGSPAGLPPGSQIDDDAELLARRVVTDHCLYGVDRNPMAAEMAKLSLWLTTMARERPFTFLDHAIHAGDSLLGVTDMEQIARFHIAPKDEGTRSFLDPESVIRPRIERALEAAQRLGEITVLTHDDAAEKARRFREITAATADLSIVADLVVASALMTAGESPRALKDCLQNAAAGVRSAFDDRRSMQERREALADLKGMSIRWLNDKKPSAASPRLAFHWPLAFPEVFLDANRVAGFDAMIGNPPFLGGKRISGRAGADYREFVVQYIANGRKGNADLVAYFFLRAATISSFVGFFATNSLSQGETRDVGLKPLLDELKWIIFRANASRTWPGTASVEVAQVWMTRLRWSGSVILDDSLVSRINSALSLDGRAMGDPEVLAQNAMRSFVGSALNCDQFILGVRDAEELLQDPRNAEVVLPYVNGDDLNANLDHMGSRRVVSFLDWPESRARKFTEAFGLLERRVRPVVLSKVKSYGGWEVRWWQFWRPREDLYSAIGSYERVIVIARTSKTLMPILAPAKQVFADAVVVFAYDDYFHLGLLTSAFHWSWVDKYPSTMRTDAGYRPPRHFETFPQPPPSEVVEAAAKALDEHRRSMMIANDEGLTKTYNRVHHPEEQSVGIVRLRRLHQELDVAVAAAYGWGDLDLDHGFHQTSQGVRYTIGPVARTEVLDRLLELNHDRYDKEVAAGLHNKKVKKGAPKRRQRMSSGAPMLMDADGDVGRDGSAND